MATNSDGKLITLTNHVTTRSTERAKYPLNMLPFYFHVPPEEYSVAGAGNHSEQDVIRRGTVSQFGGPGLSSINFSGIFVVKEWYDHLQYQSTNPSFMVTRPNGFIFRDARQSIPILENIRNMGLITQLRIQDRNTGHMEVNMPVTIRSFEWSEKGGDPDIREFSIEMVQYKFLLIRNVPRGGTVPRGDNDTPVRGPTNGRLTNSPYTVPFDMGIKRLALMAYRNMNVWGLIANANGGTKALVKNGATWGVRTKYGPVILTKGMKVIVPDHKIYPSSGT